VTHPPVTPQRRAVDQGPFRAPRAWWERWGGLITAIWLFIVTAVLIYVALAFYYSQRRQEHDAAVAAYQSTLYCRRTIAFGPALATAYQRFQILDTAQLKNFRETIPEKCPALPAQPPK
jgi:quinol-cytochrome oxidoreductase complex cytochrome b subunit